LVELVAGGREKCEYIRCCGIMSDYVDQHHILKNEEPSGCFRERQ